MNRIDRISAILIQLQSKSVITAQEIAERFDISIRTVYRDIRAIEEAGVPIGAEAGKGYYLIEGYNLPPVMFTKQEAGALIVAGKLVAKHSDTSIMEHYNSGLYKIKSVLKNTDKDYLAKLDQHIDVLRYKQRSEEFPNNWFSQILDAIADNKLLNITYRSQSKNELTKRTVEPMRICHYSMNWHLLGFCKLRKDLRDFRLDRIHQIETSTVEFVPRKENDIDLFFQRMMESEKIFKFTISFSEETTKFIQQTRYYYGFIEERLVNNQIEMDFIVNSTYYFANWILTLGKGVTKIHSDKLKLILSELSNELYHIYND